MLYTSTDGYIESNMPSYVSAAITANTITLPTSDLTLRCCCLGMTNTLRQNILIFELLLLTPPLSSYTLGQANLIVPIQDFYDLEICPPCV